MSVLKCRNVILTKKEYQIYIKMNIIIMARYYTSLFIFVLLNIRMTKSCEKMDILT